MLKVPSEAKRLFVLHIFKMLIFFFVNTILGQNISPIYLLVSG